MDYAKARMSNFSLGRFTSPDNFLNGTRPENPASWNLYVYVLNNPLRYIDPTGELERDADGNVIFRGEKIKKETVREKMIDKKTGKEVKIGGKTAYVTKTYSREEGYVKANNGKKIEAQKISLSMELTDDKGNALQVKEGDAKGKADLAEAESTVSDYRKTYDTTTNCHGTSFANGSIWINNDQVKNLINGDGYRVITGDEQAQAGDVVIYSKDGKLGGIKHSATLNTNLSTVKSKSGEQLLQPSVPVGPGPGTAWPDPTLKISIWTQRSKQ